MQEGVDKTRRSFSRNIREYTCRTMKDCCELFSVYLPMREFKSMSKVEPEEEFMITSVPLEGTKARI